MSDVAEAPTREEKNQFFVLSRGPQQRLRRGYFAF